MGLQLLFKRLGAHQMVRCRQLHPPSVVLKPTIKSFNKNGNGEKKMGLEVEEKII